MQKDFEEQSDNQVNSVYNSILKGLQEFGLTQTEAKIYMFLAKNGSKKAIEITKNQKIPRTETYHILSNLQKKGIVTSTIDRPTKFQGVSFVDALSSLISNEQKKIESLKIKQTELIRAWDLLPNNKNENDDITENRIQILQGKNSITSKLEEISSNPKENLLVIGNEKNLSMLYHSRFHSNLRKAGTKLQILTSQEKKTNYVLKGISETCIKTYPKELQKNEFYVIKDKSEMVIFLNSNFEETEEMIAIWTNSKDLVTSFKTLFELTWLKINSTDIPNDLSVNKLREIYQHGLKEVEQEKTILQVLNNRITNMQESN